MECTIFTHIRIGSSAFSVQNKRHLHWKEIGTNSVMNNDMGGAVVAHNLLLKRDPSSTEHLVHKQKMASILASPRAARKKRFVKLECGNLKNCLPTGANPFQVPKVARNTAQHGSGSELRDVETEGTKLPPSILATHPTPIVATLTWPSVGVKPNTWKSWGFGVLRDSRMFRARQQDPKHLALGCSWCHWKGLEA